MPDINPSGLSIIILAGTFAGKEGVCLGPAAEAPGLWAVSPNDSVAIVKLRFPAEFGVLVNPGQEPDMN